MDPDLSIIPMRPQRSQYSRANPESPLIRLAVAQGIMRWIERQPDCDDWEEAVTTRWLIARPTEPPALMWQRNYEDLWKAMQAARWLAGQRLDMTVWGDAMPLVRGFLWSGEWLETIP